MENDYTTRIYGAISINATNNKYNRPVHCSAQYHHDEFAKRVRGTDISS